MSEIKEVKVKRFLLIIAIFLSTDAQSTMLDIGYDDFNIVIGETYPGFIATWDFSDDNPNTTDYIFDWGAGTDGNYWQDTMSASDGIVYLWGNSLPYEIGEYVYTISMSTIHVIGGDLNCGYHSSCWDEDLGLTAEVITIRDSMNITVSAVPVPAAAWLFGSGIIGLIGVARRKKI